MPYLHVAKSLAFLYRCEALFHQSRCYTWIMERRLIKICGKFRPVSDTIVPRPVKQIGGILLVVFLYQTVQTRIVFFFRQDSLYGETGF